MKLVLAVVAGIYVVWLLAVAFDLGNAREAIPIALLGPLVGFLVGRVLFRMGDKRADK